MAGELLPIAKEAAPVIAKIFDRFGTTIGAKAGGVAKHIVDAVIADFRIGFSEFLATSYQKCHVVKTLLSQDKPLPLLDFYVNLKLRCRETECSDDTLISRLDHYKNIVVTGLAGCGKSMFMKYLTICRFENPKGLIPLFVEMRQINSLTSKDLLAFIYTSATASANNKVTRDQFDLAMKAGTLLLILDGLDEVEHTRREDLSKQILDLSLKFPDTTVVISSRPDDQFGSWNTFHIFEVSKLTKTQVLGLIDKIDYEKEIKGRFRKEVDRKLYQSHQSFLSSPLLASIMLLTYEQFAEIPNKMHIFYELAFDTLFRRHDAQKAQFIRKTHSNLPIDDFKKFFAAFCAMSYLEEQFALSEADLQRFIQSALEFSQITANAADLILDLRNSVCMLQQDGTDMVFVHRSFQEYFASLFITTYHGPNCRSLIDRFALRSADSVMPMILEMAREKVEQEWVLPNLEEVVNKLDGAAHSLQERINAVLTMIQVGLEFEDHVPQANFHMASTGESYRISNLIFSLYGRSGFLYEVLWKHGIEDQISQLAQDAGIREDADDEELGSCFGVERSEVGMSFGISRTRSRRPRSGRSSAKISDMQIEVTFHGFGTQFARRLHLEEPLAQTREALKDIQADITRRLEKRRGIVELLFQPAKKKLKRSKSTDRV